MEKEGKREKRREEEREDLVMVGGRRVGIKEDEAAEGIGYECCCSAEECV